MKSKIDKCYTELSLEVKASSGPTYSVEAFPFLNSFVLCLKTHENQKLAQETQEAMNAA